MNVVCTLWSYVFVCTLKIKFGWAFFAWVFIISGFFFPFVTFSVKLTHIHEYLSQIPFLSVRKKNCGIYAVQYSDKKLILLISHFFPISLNIIL